MTLLTQYGVQPHIFDIQGNTPLHYASVSYHPNALALVKVLVTQYGADVIVKNAVGQTAYDVSVKDPIRHFLLPLQLQKETQQCLDNGGVGLPQGIVMGGVGEDCGDGVASSSDDGWITATTSSSGPAPECSSGTNESICCKQWYSTTTTTIRTPTTTQRESSTTHLRMQRTIRSSPQQQQQQQQQQKQIPRRWIQFLR